MIARSNYLKEIRKLISFYPVTAILGPRQCGKTTLAQILKADHFFDLENPRDLTRLDQPQLVLERLEGLIVIDEIQLKPSLFSLLRYLVDYNPQTKYVILGSASPDLLRQSNQTLAGRIGFLYLNGFNMAEVANAEWRKLWWRGSFPNAFLAPNDEFASRWIDDYISTFLERDISQFGIQVSSVALRRFWIMLSHYHSNIVNYSNLGRSLQLDDKTIRNYL
ncbi:MAG: AAA family ATPase, partial [Bacteroidota bacterium]